ncbi:MAG: rhodanese-like domain-containing protein [Polyangiaceae bacterium]
MTHALFRNAAAHADGFRDVDPLLFHEHPKDARMIDVREPHEYNGELGHIAGTELVPLATVAGRATEWDRDKEIVVICRSGGRSANAARQLVALGFTRVMNLRGGMLAWNQAKLPVERG